MPLTIKIIQGDDVHSLMREPEFLSQWRNLAEHTSHVTVFQEPPFVSCWYEQYRAAYMPVLVLGYDDNNTLSGLLPLALNTSSQALSHAGDQQVEYSGWLCSDDYKLTFISQALATANKQLTFSKWTWSTIPPHADVTWLTAPSKELKQLHTSYNVIESPILNLHNEDKLKKVLKNKSVKSKINRLKRKGDLRIERITEPQRVTELIDDITNLVNFRHGAAHGDLAFNEDPFQKAFYHARGKNLVNNHFSVLWMGEKLLAFHFGGIDKNTIYIGLTAFDPTQSKHSPGVIFLIFLANLMKEEGIQYIDLTPGGDEYKERFSNQHHTLYCPIFFKSALQKYQYDCKKNIKRSILSSLNKFGIEKEKFTKTSKSSQHDEANINTVLLKANSSNVSPDIAEKNIINIQNYSDLLLHSDVNDSQVMQSLLSRATQRFSKEETLFTLTANNKLSGMAWMSKPGNKHKRLGSEFAASENSVVIEVTDNQQKEIEIDVLEPLLTKMVFYAKANGIDVIYYLLASNTSSSIRKVFTNIGFCEEQSN